MKHNVFLYVKNHFGVLFTLIFFGASACEEDGSCFTDDTNVATVQFVKLINNTGGNTQADELTSREIRAAGSESVYPIENNSFALLPLNPSENTTTFYIFQEQDGISRVDTLVLTYGREQALVSPECGPYQRFFELDATRSTFDSLRIRNPEITQGSLSASTVNLQILTCRYEMTNVMRLRFNYEANENEVVDTLYVGRVYSPIGKVDLLQDTLIAEGGNLTVAVPVARDDNQVQVILETADAVPVSYDIRAYYHRDTIRVADCLPQDRYRLDSIQLGDNPGRFTEADVSEDNETFNLNNAVNAEVTVE